MATSGGSSFSSTGKACSSTYNPPSQAEGVYLQNKVVGQQRLQISEVHFNEFRTCSSFSCWNVRFKTEVCACSGSASEAMVWIKEVGMVDSVMIFKSSRSNQEHHFTDFEVLDSKTATAPKEICQIHPSKWSYHSGKKFYMQSVFP